jgi:membrane-associated phospholipid phosphatase
MKGFPSGHAAYSFGSMLFIVQILFHTFRPHMHSFLAMILCLSPLTWAGKITVTRYWEHSHTAIELFAGMVIGLIVSVLSFRAYRAKSKIRHHRLCCAGESPSGY